MNTQNTHMYTCSICKAHIWLERRKWVMLSQRHYISNLTKREIQCKDDSVFLSYLVQWYFLGHIIIISVLLMRWLSYCLHNSFWYQCLVFQNSFILCEKSFKKICLNLSVGGIYVFTSPKIITSNFLCLYLYYFQLL